MSNACGVTEASCECINEECDGIHVCKCGGSWSGGPEGHPSFKVHKYAGGFDDPLDSLLFGIRNPGLYS
jgi:hypothetical protein